MVLTSTPARKSSPASKILPPYPRISIPYTSLRYPVCHQRVGRDLDFAPNASLISPHRISALLCTPECDLINPLDLNDDNEDSRITSRDERKANAMNLGSLYSPGSGAIRIRPALRSQRFRVFHNDQPHSRSVSPAAKTQTTSLELPNLISPTRQRPFKWRNGLGALFVRVQQSRILAHPTSYIALYFTLNLSLTLYNKSLLNKNFPFPYTLSALHALCGSIGCAILVRNGSSPVPRLNAQETFVLLAFSGLYTVNIIVSNISLGLVTVPFHQVVRASTPLFTILFSVLILGIRSSRRKLISLLPVVAGVGFATYGDYYFTFWGFFLTLLGTILASLKTIFTNVLQASPTSAPLPKAEYQTPKHKLSYQAVLYDIRTSGISPPPPLYLSKLPPLSPLHLLYLLSPLAFVETILLAHYTGELDQALECIGLRFSTRGSFTQVPPLSVPKLSSVQVVLLLINGAMAFALNVVSFSANRKVGALSMTVAANVKQVLTILCAMALFNLTITPMNAIGIVLTLVGGAVYAMVELEEKRERR